MAQITLARYFLDRLADLGIDCVFGVPGDYDLNFLDAILEHPTVRWIGCVNELNAAYAADGWARTSGRPACLMTVFGVGELSAMNGIAGCFAESVPIIHLVGKPALSIQNRRATVHHCMSPGRYDQTAKMFEPVSVAQALITSIHDNHGRTAAQEIDRVIKVCIQKSKPVYISLPFDLVLAEISSESLKEKISMQSVQKELIGVQVNQGTAVHVVEAIVDMYKRSSHPCILVDFGVIRFHLREQVEQLIEAGNLPFFTTPLGKGALDEDHPNFRGVYFGAVTQQYIREQMDSCDSQIQIGPLNSDLNTGGFSHKMPKEKIIELHSDMVKIQHGEYPSVNFHSVLPLLIKAISALPKKEGKKAKRLNQNFKVEGQHDEMVKQDAFWAAVPNILQDGDTILVDAGTCSFGILEVKMPRNVTVCSQVLWGSIGFAGGATLGAALAAKSQGRRCILFTGEGAWQETIQDLSTIIRLGLSPILFVINNDGYTVERLLRGPNQSYNDVPVWDWQNALSFMGAKEGSYRTYSIKTAGQLQQLFDDKTFLAAEQIQLVEVFMGKHDAPRTLKEQCEMVARANAGKP